ncbi:hypothetical protein GCM10010336_54210 [Streptomyces goshikiensis]|nr:hypothetical protein GCM10010336_54210 [Streptomyces goshikiensis]
MGVGVPFGPVFDWAVTRLSTGGTTFVMAADAPSAAATHNTAVTTVRLSTTDTPPPLLWRSMPRRHFRRKAQSGQSGRRPPDTPHLTLHAQALTDRDPGSTINRIHRTQF